MRKKIKVIRKRDVETVEQESTKTTDGKKNQARKIVSNVSGWVNDFQKRKREETKQAFDKIFPAEPQTDSV